MARKKKRAFKHRAVKKRSLKAIDKQNIRMLAVQLGELTPYSSQFGRGLSWTNIAREKKLSKFLPQKYSNKKEALAQFLEKLLSYKPNTLHKILRDNFAKAIDYRLKRGNPILKAEALRIVDSLASLKINMKKEILDLQLPTDRPATVPPDYRIKQMLANLNFHGLLLPECRDLFEKGHANEAARKALEKFESTVKGVSGLGATGRNLMETAFDLQRPIIKLNPLLTREERNEQEGFKLISMGIMAWWRNNLSHDDAPALDHRDAIGRLLLVSNLLHKLDGRPT